VRFLSQVRQNVRVPRNARSVTSRLCRGDHYLRNYAWLSVGPASLDAPVRRHPMLLPECASSLSLHAQPTWFRRDVPALL
jgi:hypothetical protein